ncbi:hypothetical protein L7F22_047697 [Adiantum nelumboides]|nr:hypothetical protein [Adiantum nelumboides]
MAPDSTDRAPTSPADTSQGTAGADVAPERDMRRGYRNVTIVYVAGIVVCLSIFSLTYYIAYKTIFLRGVAAVNARWVPDTEALENDGSGGVAVCRGGGTDALRIASLPVVQYASSAPTSKLAIKGADSSSGDANEEAGDSNKLRVKGTISSAKECAVCLSEFDDGEDVKLLPACGHCFHVKCIDMWLFSHTNCPICRVGV